AAEYPLFGPLDSFGLAGAASDLLGDRSYRIPPLTDVDAAAMVREARSAPSLLGYRGSEPTDTAALERLLRRLAALKDDLPEIAEVAFEPVLANADGYSVLSARARAVHTGDIRSDWYVRRLSKPVGLGDTLAD